MGHHRPSDVEVGGLPFVPLGRDLGNSCTLRLRRWNPPPNSGSSGAVIGLAHFFLGHRTAGDVRAVSKGCIPLLKPWGIDDFDLIAHALCARFDLRRRERPDANDVWLCHRSSS